MTKILPDAPGTTEEATNTECGLGRDLGDCSLRDAGCNTLHDVLGHLIPPFELIAELRNRRDLSPSVASWLRRVEGIGLPVHRRWR